MTETETEMLTRAKYRRADAQFRRTMARLARAAAAAETSDQPQHELDAALDRARTHALDLARRLVDAAIVDERAHTAAVRARSEAAR